MSGQIQFIVVVHTPRSCKFRDTSAPGRLIGIPTRGVTDSTAAGLVLRRRGDHAAGMPGKLRLFSSSAAPSLQLNTDVSLAYRLLPDKLFLIARWRLPMTPEQSRSSEEVLRRVQGEFLEMPGLRLTEPQARRLWGLDAASCAALLGALVEAKFLFRTRDGAFMRVEHAAPVRTSIRPRHFMGAA